MHGRIPGKAESASEMTVNRSGRKGERRGRTRGPLVSVRILEAKGHHRKSARFTLCLNMKSYKAPWSRSLVAVSTLACLLCLGLSFLLARKGLPWLAALVPV